MRYQPMKAHEAKDPVVLLADPDYVAERKYDGHRMVLEQFPHLDEPRLYSRLGNDRIDDAPFLKELASRWNTDVVLDGELYLPGGTSSDVTDRRNRDGLVFVVFDVLVYRGDQYTGYPYWRRRQMLESIVAGIDDFRLLLPEVSDKPSELLAQVRSEGGEGIMMKKKDGAYQPGKRSWDWQKIKVWKTASVIITGADAPPSKWTVTPGNYGTDGVFYPEGKPSSTAEAGYVGLTYGFWMDGKPVTIGKLGVTGSPEEMKQHVGKVGEVKFYGQYRKTRALRHVQFLGFREDVRPEECAPDQE